MKKVEIKGVLQLYIFLPATNIMIRSLNIKPCAAIYPSCFVSYSM